MSHTPTLFELELELRRQDQLFERVREALAELGAENRLSIPEATLDELDAAFASLPSVPATESFGSRVRA